MLTCPGCGNTFAPEHVGHIYLGGVENGRFCSAGCTGTKHFEKTQTVLGGTSVKTNCQPAP